MSAARALPAPGSIGAWRAAARPPTLTAAVAPVLVGTGAAIGDGVFAAGPFVAALFGALCLQIGANFANDVFDFERGADTGDRLGPPRATQMGLLTPLQMKIGMWAAFLLAFLAGIYLVVVAGWIVVVIGLASIVAGLIYTGGPWPVGYHALGDAFTFVFFGMVAVVGTYFVQAEAAPGMVWLAAVPVGCTVTAILVANNLRDLATDRAAGRRRWRWCSGSGGRAPGTSCCWSRPTASRLRSGPRRASSRGRCLCSRACRSRSGHCGRSRAGRRVGR